MSRYPRSVVNLIKSLSRLPGIGEKTAERLALHILKAPGVHAEQLSGSILKMKKSVRYCSRCFALSDGELCDICTDPGREKNLLCVVEQPADMVSIEKSGAFSGLYHILSGALSPIDGVGPDDIRIKELLSRASTGEVKEVILATGMSVEGESTASYIAEILKNRPIKVTRIAQGVPAGGDLKYVDQATMKKAMETRHDF